MSTAGQLEIHDHARAMKNVLYCTDVEGNWDYFKAFIARCKKGVTFTEDMRLELHPEYIFVFGGDVGDKGIGTLRIIQILLDVKTRYPDRVVLIAGNRDVNKMRWTSEFTEVEMNMTTMDPGIKDGPHWLAAEAREKLSLKSFLCNEILNTINCDDDLEKVNTKINRMLWILKCTMGSVGDFERRREELSILMNTSSITDEIVFQSFVESVEDGGLMRKYLEVCVLGYIHGSTIFLHGGVLQIEGVGDTNTTRNSVGLVPPADSRKNPYATWIADLDALAESKRLRTQSIHRWIEDLNQWYLAQINEWKKYPTWQDAEHSFRGGENLQRYVLTASPYSVISGRHLEKSGMPARMTRKMTQHFLCDGIERLIIGHTPHGNTPTIVKHLVDNSTFEVIMCDTSYSNMQAKDMRGNCVSTLLIDQQQQVWIDGFVEIQADTLEFETEYSFSTNDRYVGHVLASGEWIKAKLNCQEYLVCRVTNGYTYTYRIATSDQVETEAILTEL